MALYLNILLPPFCCQSSPHLQGKLVRSKPPRPLISAAFPPLAVFLSGSCTLMSFSPPAGDERRVLRRLRAGHDVPARHPPAPPSKAPTNHRRTSSMITTHNTSPGPDRSAESCPRREKKRPTRHLRPSPKRQNAPTRIPRRSPQDRIRPEATTPRSKRHNTARVDQPPSKNRGKAFPKG